MKSMKEITISGFKKGVSLKDYKTFDNQAKALLLPEDKISREYQIKIKDYWNKYGLKVNGYWHTLYASRYGEENVRFIDDSMYFSIMQFCLNDLRFSQAYGDKNNYDTIFAKVNRPDTIARNMNGDFLDSFNKRKEYDNVIEDCLNTEKIIIKPAVDSCAGHGISVFVNDGTSTYREKVIQDLANKKKNYIIQKFIKQHKDMEKFNASTVNTVRILSLNFEGEIHILPCVIRIGTPNVDILFGHNDCYVYGVDNKGVLTNKCIDFKMRPTKNIAFSGAIIPNFTGILDVVRNEHIKIPYVKYIGWDFSVDSNGDPCLIEINTLDTGISNSQALGGPLFGELTDAIVKYCISKDGFPNSINTRII